jgi:hypothetical protein
MKEIEELLPVVGQLQSILQRAFKGRLTEQR